MIDQQQDTVITANDGPAADAVAAAVLAAQMKIIDAAVRNARQAQWCEEFERIMRELFPNGSPDGSAEFVDSDGVSCRGLDREGRDSEGFDRQGWNRDGYNRRGFDRDGFNRDGFNRYGRDRDGYDPQGFNAQGFNREGFNADGLHVNSPEYRERFKYDAWGFDRDGFNSYGQDRQGYERAAVEDRGGVFRFDDRGRDVTGQYGR